MSIFMPSCKQNVPTEPEEEFTGEMSATIEGTEWESGNPIHYSSITNMISGTHLVVNNGDISDAYTISIQLTQIDNSLEVRTYSAICFYQESIGVYPNTQLYIWSDMSGTSKITEVTDEIISGTFTFTGTNDEDNSTKFVTGKFYALRH